MEKEPEGKLVSTWESVTKNAEGEAEIHILHKHEYPDQPVDLDHFITQAAPTRIYSNRTHYEPHSDKILADVPDIHYGLRNTPEGLKPTHNPEVMDVWLQIMKDVQPDVILLGGDMIDIPELSKFDQDSRHFMDTLQNSIDGLYRYLSRLRAVHGDMAKKTTGYDYIQRDGQNTLFHHTHRREYGRRTFPNGKSLEAFSAGCQADTRGSIPSSHNGVDDMGRVVERYENWDNGGLLLEYSDKNYKVEQVPIEQPDYEAMREGRIYSAREEVAKALANGM